MDSEGQIRESYSKKATDRGDCPASEDLVRYHQRQLTSEEMLRIKQHVDVCGSCDWSVVELWEFDSVASSAVPEPEESRRKGFLILFHPAFAYGIVLVLLYPAYRGLFYSDRSWFLSALCILLSI